MGKQVVNFGSVFFSEDGTADSFVEIISRLDLRPPVIIKPNWATAHIFTEKEILDWTLEAIEEEIIVVESYAPYRSKLLVNHSGIIDSSLEKELIAQKKTDYRRNEDWFLKNSGIGQILEKHEVEYLNLTEEVWAGRTCSADTIRTEVESRFGPLENEILYSLVPSRLYDMRGGSILSLTKAKTSFGLIGISLTLKNMFGMIPGPRRGKFHGKKDCKLNQSIIDINKIYMSLFHLRGLVEAVFSTTRTIDPVNPTIYRNLGYVWGSNHGLELDAFITAQMGLDPYIVGHLALAAEQIGSWPHETVQLGRLNAIVLPEKDVV
ncbi:MAG: DUF362 domain-containing protein [Promethearchaeota archaeon]